MRWVTRARPKTDRIACPWLILRFIDRNAEIIYVASDEVLAYAEQPGAHSFDAPGAEFTHRDGKCTFEVLVEEFGIDDPAVHRLAAIIHGADIDGEIDTTPQSAGILAMAEGFRLMEADDQASLRLQLPVYDALYAWARQQVGPGEA